MRILLWILLTGVMITSCKNSTDAPDVSDVKISLTTQRFEQDFFRLDSSEFKNGLEKLLGKYPAFGENFISTILNTDPAWSEDTALNYIKGFKTVYQPVFDTSQRLFKDFSP